MISDNKPNIDNVTRKANGIKNTILEYVKSGFKGSISFKVYINGTGITKVTQQINQDI